MNRTDDTLRTLDAAPATLTAAERERAGALLDRIVAVEAPATATPPTFRRRGGLRSRRLRLALVPLSALALAGGLVLAQGSGPDAAAYASWTSVPSTPDPQSLALADAACRARLHGRGNERSDPSFFDVDRARTDLADRRGDFVAIVYSTPDPDLAASCIVHHPRSSDDVDASDISVIGSSGSAQVVPADGYFPGGVSGTTEGVQAGPTGLARLLDPAPRFQGSVTSGSVGSDVVGVTVHAGAFTVQATVADGRYGAWWPGPAFRGPSTPPPSGKDPYTDITTYDLHLADGSTVTDARPLLPR